MKYCLPLNGQIGSWKIAPALAAGNSIVLKPAETASLALLKIAQLAAEAGLPMGCFNVVTGTGQSELEANLNLLKPLK